MTSEIVPSNQEESGLWLTGKESPTRGLVAAEERSIIRSETRKSLLVAGVGFLFPPLGKWQRKIYAQVLEEEMTALGQELEEKGLIGEHNLVQSSVVREKIARSHGSFNGSIFSISGSYDSETKSESKILFAWQTAKGAIVLSESEARKIEIIIEDKEIPSVEFEFDASRLISQPLYGAGALVRKSFRHPNGYINSSLVTVTIRGKSPGQINEFLLALGEKD